MKPFRRSKAASRKPSRRGSTTQLQVEALEARWVPATIGLTKTAALDFDGAYISASHLQEGGWNAGMGDHSFAGFNTLFNDSRPWLDVNSDGAVNGADADLAIAQILAKVRTDYAPFKLNVTEMDQTQSRGLLHDGLIGDVSVVITAGKSEDFTPQNVMGLAPSLDAGNTRDNLVFVFAGGSVDFFAGDRERWFNQLARTLSHEMGHSFGLEHETVDSTGDADAISHSIMSTAERDWSRDFVFEDHDLITEDGVQNAHQYLLREDILGRSERAYLAVLRPGELTIVGNSAANSIQIYQASPTRWLAIVDGTASYIDLESQDILSLNPFAADISAVRIQGGAGNDYLFVAPDFAAKATLLGGSGQDTLFGGSGNDALWGGEGNDYVNGRAGDDLLIGGGGEDVMIGDLGSDRIDGGGGDDYLYGQGGADRLYGEEGDDRLDGGSDGLADVLSDSAGTNEFQAERYFDWSGTDWLAENRDKPVTF